MKRALLLLPFALIGCRNESERIPLFGKWDIEFLPQKTAESRYTLSGYLMLYRNRDEFVLNVEGEQQGIEAKGTWRLERGRVMLTTKDVAIDDNGGEELRDPNKVYIANEAVRATFTRPMALRVSEDRKQLDGLLTSFGEVLGSFRAKRP